MKLSKRWRGLALLLFLAVDFYGARLVANPGELVYVASERRDIYSYRLDQKTGALTLVGNAAPLAQPSFLASTPKGDLLYSVSGGKTNNSFITAFRIDKNSGALALINHQPTAGAGPCYVAVDSKARYALAANYGSGSVAMFPLNRQGALEPISAFVQDHGSSVDPQRQKGPYAHCVLTSPDDRYVFDCDLGLDQVLSFKLDSSKGLLIPNTPPFATVPPGQGPRHLAFRADGRTAYVANEMGSTVTVFSYESKSGLLRPEQTLPMLPPEFYGHNTAAEILVHPSGKFVYASNRGDDSIVEWSCRRDGRLDWVQRAASGGRTPRSMTIDSSGKFLLVANLESDNLVVFRIDRESGNLTPLGPPVSISSPICVTCLPAGRCCFF